MRLKILAAIKKEFRTCGNFSHALPTSLPGPCGTCLMDSDWRDFMKASA